MKTKHTAGRVEFISNRIIGRDASGQTVEICSIGEIDLLEKEAREQIESNVQHLVACWNACAGIEHPEKTIPALRSAALRLWEHACETYPHFECIRGRQEIDRLRLVLQKVPTGGVA